MPAGTLLRPAVPEDAAACAAVFNAWVDATDWMPRVHPAEAVARHIGGYVLPERAVTVAARDGVVVGFMALGVGQVDGLYLGPEARRRGIGAALIGLAKAAWPEGLTLRTFVANGPARAFYAAQGFVEAPGNADNDEGLPDLLLTWPGDAVAGAR